MSQNWSFVQKTTNSGSASYSLKREAWVDVTTFLFASPFEKASPFLQDTKILHDEIELQHDFKFKIHREEKENNFSRIPQRQGLASRHIFQSTNIPKSTQASS
jgi:hypothetical protein